jgi:hypothetical protein
MTLREQELARQLSECREALVQSRRENELLRQKLDALARRIFGVSSGWSGGACWGRCS